MMFMMKNIFVGIFVAAVGLVGLSHKMINNPKANAVKESALMSASAPMNKVNENSGRASHDDFILPDVAAAHKDVCSAGNPDEVKCHAKVITDDKGAPQYSSGPIGYKSLQFRTAYNLLSATGSKLVAIVDAYDQPNIFSDVNKYSSTTGIALMNNGNATTSACSIASGTACFKKVNQNGGTPFPAGNQGWGHEISLDVEVVHAVCPTCNVLLVEANSNSFSDLNAAISRAITLGAKIVSNSWSSREFSGETSLDSVFSSNPTVAFMFSSGDAGYGTGYPAASKYVVSVGGTSLNISTSNAWVSETTWSGTGSGCSAYESKPSWQHDSDCSKRMENDIAADANPNTGAAVYDTYMSDGGGWMTFGGTSLSAPIIAAVYALTGQSSFTNAASIPYTRTSFLHDISIGSNGSSCGKSKYFCTAGTGYDGPTGLGTPNGVGAF